MRRMGLGWAAVVTLAVVGLTSGCKLSEKVGLVGMSKHKEVVDRLQNEQAENGRLKMDNEAIGRDAEEQRNRSKQLDVQLQAANLELKKMKDTAASRTSSADAKLSAIQAQLKRLASTEPSKFEWNSSNGSLVVRVQFALGSAELQAGSKPILAEAADVLKGVSTSYVIYIDGHTDDLPVVRPETKGKFGDLWGLGAHRALSVLRALQTQGVSQNRMVARSFADRDPLVHGKTVDARRRNRRVEISVAPAAAAAHLASTTVAPKPPK